MAVRTAMLPPAPPRKVTLRRRGVEVILLFALLARALVRKSGDCWGACWAKSLRRTRPAVVAAARAPVSGGRTAVPEALSDSSVFRRPFRVVDDDHLHRHLRRDELQAELLLNG